MNVNPIKNNFEKEIAFLFFLRDFLKDPMRIGAISPSSNVLAKAMMNNLLIAAGDSVVEFGPGTGVFTQKIREKTNLYLGIERNPRFTQILNRRFPNMSFINGLAEERDHHHRKIGLPPPKVIVCGLPLSMWSKELQNSIIDVLESLMQPGSVFRTFQYAHSYVVPAALRFRRKMNARFGPHQRSGIVLRNLTGLYFDLASIKKST